MLHSRLLLFCDAACKQGRPADRSQAEDQSVRTHPACHVSRVSVLLVTGLGVLVAVRALHDTLRGGREGGDRASASPNLLCRGSSCMMQCTHMCTLSRPLADLLCPQTPSATLLCSRVGGRSLQVGQIAGLSRCTGLGQQAPPAGGVDGASGRGHTAASIACCTAVLGP